MYSRLECRRYLASGICNHKRKVHSSFMTPIGIICLKSLKFFFNKNKPRLLSLKLPTDSIAWSKVTSI